LAGQYHPFGGSSQPLSFAESPTPARHWLEAGDQVQGVDIKWLWEPARFTWAYELAHAWLLTKDERYADFFWQKFREFNEHNPANSAPNFTSAQEVGIRLLNWLMVYQVLRDATASGADEKRLLAKAVWQHAARIPATLGYARSQNTQPPAERVAGTDGRGDGFRAAIAPGAQVAGTGQSDLSTRHPQTGGSGWNVRAA
jgi:hypothetical protein